jgi:glycosyltransferase involved in cell wall biosynthesis
MNLLQVTHFPVYPPKRGGEHRKHGIVKSFVQAGDIVNRFAQAVDVNEFKLTNTYETIEIDEGYYEYHNKNPVHSIHRANLLVGLPYLFHGATLRIWKPKILKKLVKDADVILVEEPWQLPAVNEYAKQTPIVYSSHNVEAVKFRPESYPRTGNWLQKVMTHNEKKAVEKADLLICVSEDDKCEFQNEYNVQCPVCVAPNGVYESAIREHNPENGQPVIEKHEIGRESFVGLFVGSDYGPNNDAVEQMIELLEAYPDKFANFHFLIVGSVSDTITDPPDNVTAAGFVDDIEPYYDAADIAVNPMRFGGGTNIKLFDYFARSLPVVSTPFGIRGIDSGEDVAHVIELSEFPHSINELKSNRQRCEAYRARGRDLIKRKYKWNSISKKVRRKVITQFGPFE